MIIGGGFIIRSGYASPPVTSGLKAHYADTGPFWQDSSRTARASVDGDPVGAWDDMSGNGNHLLQATAGKRPLIKLGIINGKKVLRGDGIDDWIEKGFTIGSQPTTIFAVCKCNNNAGLDIWSSMGGGVEFKRNGAGWYVYAGVPVGMNGGSSDGNFHVLSLKLNGASSELWKDGSLNLSGNPGGSLMDGVTLFSQGSSHSGIESGDMAEYLLYNRLLDSTEFGSVRDFLRTKYAL